VISSSKFLLGTGKSYVGVALVLAFVIIRNELRAHGHALGPVLMLSYKNHALDEFLLDVVKFSPSKINLGELIRVGKPESEELNSFTERSCPSEKDAEKELIDRLKVTRQLQKVEREWRNYSNQLRTKAEFLVSSNVLFERFSSVLCLLGY